MIHRYEALTGHCMEPDGEWIKYEDHVKEIERLRKALEFYADGEWNGYVTDKVKDLSVGNVIIDRGKIAQQALRGSK